MASKKQYHILEDFIILNAEHLFGKLFEKVRGEKHFQRLLNTFLQEERKRLQKVTTKHIEKTRGLEGYIKKRGWDSTKSKLGADIENIERKREVLKKKKQELKTAKDLRVTEIKAWETGIYKAETKKLGTKKASARKKSRLEAYDTFGTTLHTLTRKELKAWGFSKTQIDRIKTK